MKKLASTESFEIKSQDSATYIEGLANKFVVDRGSDIIQTDAWDLESFKKNPIILVNHGMDTMGGIPVGKAVEVRPTDKGLFIKVRLSNSKVPAIQMIRDLVEERILQAFSVGFDPKEVVPIEMEGKTVNNITKAELFEVSIVGVPMNQDSLFTVSEKSLKTKSLYQIKSELLKARGCKYAQSVHEKMHTLEESGEDREELISRIAEFGHLETLEIKDILAGNIEANEDFKKAANSILKMDDSEKEDDEESAKEDDENGRSKESGKEEESEDKEDKEKSDGKSSGSEEELREEAEEKAGSGQDKLKDFQSCVSGKLPGKLSDGMDQDEAVAAAINECQESGKCLLSAESKQKAYSTLFTIVDNFKETGEWDFATLSAADILLDSTDKTIEAEEKDNKGLDDSDFGNPYLDQQKQTNVLLGTLVESIRSLSEKVENLSGVRDLPSEDETIEDDKGLMDEEDDSETKESETESEEETLEEKANKALDSLNARLKKLGY